MQTAELGTEKILRKIDLLAIVTYVTQDKLIQSFIKNTSIDIEMCALSRKLKLSVARYSELDI